MANKYLLGADVENDANKRKARLLGIAHELYVQRVENKGGKYDPQNNKTVYGCELKTKKADSGNRDEYGDVIWTYSDEYALEIDDTSEDYSNLIDIHSKKIKEQSDLENDGWDLT